MRARTVKPEFFRDKKMGQLGPVVALVYQALWVSADDYGTARADAEQLKGDMFTYWPGVSCADIAQALRTLCETDRTVCYRVGDDVYARIVRWDEHQKVHMPGKFRYPVDGTPLTAEQPSQPCADPVQPCADTASPLLHYSTTPSTTTASTKAARERASEPEPASTALVMLPSNGNGNGAHPAVVALQAVAQGTERRERRALYARAVARFVFGYWAARTGHRLVREDPKRMQRIAARLAEAGGDPRDLLYAVDGALRDDWIMGRKPNSDRKYDGVETIFRDRGQVERLAALVPAWAAGEPHPQSGEIAPLTEVA